ncbi:putative F-box protein PP2-B12 isoform X2 [Senna tora]|uniref:Putative F-box protein PP2-B12 isoform X2 n=1 Tax=Senna tora TaxID=362788 RepID=A0A834XBW2_9FABA|nr:putative F-box protein PP2-B12 isoform X2 [Senna tora]
MASHDGQHKVTSSSNAHWKGDGTYEGDLEFSGLFRVPVRALNIVWGNDPRFWQFMYLKDDESRLIGFNQCALLVQVNWIEVTGKIPLSLLYRASSPTRYEIYYVVKFRVDAFGWHSAPIKFKVRLNNNNNNNNNGKEEEEEEEESEYEKSIIFEAYRKKQEEWHEIPGGEFSVSKKEGFVEFGMFEVESAWWKGNMVLAGVKIKAIV